MKSLLLMSLFAFGCATGNYNPEAGQCEKAGPVLLRDMFTDTSHIYCLERQARLENEKEHEDRMKNDPEYAEEEKQRLQRIQDEKLAEEKTKRDEQEFYQKKHRAVNVGVSIEEFRKYHGEPNTKEARNGKLIYWYDYKLPIFVVFTNNKISEIIVDRDTIQRRKNEEVQAEQNRAAERRHQQNLNEAQAARDQAYWNSFSNSLTNSINNSKPVTTDCKKDYYGNITCTSY